MLTFLSVKVVLFLSLVVNYADVLILIELLIVWIELFFLELFMHLLRCLLIQALLINILLFLVFLTFFALFRFSRHVLLVHNLGLLRLCFAILITVLRLALVFIILVLAALVNGFLIVVNLLIFCFLIVLVNCAFSILIDHLVVILLGALVLHLLLKRLILMGHAIVDRHLVWLLDRGKIVTILLDVVPFLLHGLLLLLIRIEILEKLLLLLMTLILHL